MTQVNMLEIKDDLTKLVNMLETKQEEIIYLTRNGTAVAQMTLIPPKKVQKRIGVAEGKFKVPDEFDGIRRLRKCLGEKYECFVGYAHSSLDAF